MQDVLDDKEAVLEKVEFYRESQYEYEDDYGGFGLFLPTRRGMVLAGSVAVKHKDQVSTADPASHRVPLSRQMTRTMVRVPEVQSPMRSRMSF